MPAETRHEIPDEEWVRLQVWRLCATWYPRLRVHSSPELTEAYIKEFCRLNHLKHEGLYDDPESE